MSDAPRQARAIRADRGDVGERLDHVLLRHLTDLPEASRTKIQEWIEGGWVSIGGRRPKKTSEKVKKGDLIEVSFLRRLRQRLPSSLRTSPSPSSSKTPKSWF